MELAGKTEQGAAARLPDAPVQADRAAHRLPARRRDAPSMHQEGAAALRQRGRTRRRSRPTSAWSTTSSTSSNIQCLAVAAARVHRRSTSAGLTKGQSLHVSDIKLPHGHQGRDARQAEPGDRRRRTCQAAEAEEAAAARRWSAAAAPRADQGARRPRSRTRSKARSTRRSEAPPRRGRFLGPCPSIIATP